MPEPGNPDGWPPLPDKRYFTIGEVSELCAVKPHVLRYWEREFAELSPAKRRGNRRYYQRTDILVVRRIRALLYEDGYTIGGAKALLAKGQAGGAAADTRRLVADIIGELEQLARLLQ